MASTERAGGAAGRVLRQPAPPSPDIREADFLALVIHYASTLGYTCYHTHDSRHSARGWPDVVICGHGRLVFAELKTRRGRVTREQTVWGGLLTAAGQTWLVLRPTREDWDVLLRLLGGAPGEE